MKQISTRIVAMILALVLCCGYSTNAHARELYNSTAGQDYLITQGDAEETASTWAVAHCGRYATHDMLSRGWGSIRTSDGTWVVDMGACHQCTRCNLVFICEGEPLSSTIGYWATMEADYTVSYLTNMYTDNIFYESGKTVEGMSFRY